MHINSSRPHLDPCPIFCTPTAVLLASTCVCVELGALVIVVDADAVALLAAADELACAAFGKKSEFLVRNRMISTMMATMKRTDITIVHPMHFVRFRFAASRASQSSLS